MKPSDFRQISLINSVLKIFSKILANRLQLVISYFILEAPTGFIKGRYISEGFLYAQEVVTMATRQKQKLGLFKANVFKAFNTLPWDFLQAVLSAKGFPNAWISLVRRAVLEGTTKVLINLVAGKTSHS